MELMLTTVPHEFMIIDVPDAQALGAIQRGQQIPLPRYALDHTINAIIIFNS